MDNELKHTISKVLNLGNLEQLDFSSEMKVFIHMDPPHVMTSST